MQCIFKICVLERPVHKEYEGKKNLHEIFAEPLFGCTLRTDATMPSQSCVFQQYLWKVENFQLFFCSYTDYNHPN
ncbi:hypothetical protein AQUCO_00900908v1 [Aquilegia coerulea]|uniref:Uncharacterized protein n=1 Tax=Aquilegia coerulea TaxID=218851 RepID=A0A2G5EGE3_AQUCA|nr:hypothetical protein AQUCO_00900908v1 [Aquilegia coerulea]